MSLGNLSIRVTADVAGVKSSMDIASKATQDAMFESSAAVAQFQKNILQASADMQKAAQIMQSQMAAANDAIVEQSSESVVAIESITEAANDIEFKSMGEKIAEGIGTGIGVGIVAAEKAWDGFVAFSKAKALVVGIAVSAVFAAVGLGAVYTAYKVLDSSMGFIVGLLTGDSYKSESIDALIEANKQVKDIQESLHLTEQQATATNAAIAAMGVDKSEYVSVFKDAADAVRSNTQELDRLGVKYKDAQGNLLPLSEVVKSANDVLNTYTEGWDRNKAAAAIGMGSAAAIAAAVSVSSEKIAQARERLNDYNLGIGAETQAAVKRYEDAMRDFNRESDLTAQGFKRAWADQIMPVLTDIAEFFKNGFPFAVNAFRYSMATVTSLLYGLKTVAYMVAESVIGSLSAIGSIIAGVAVAGIRLATGDFTGAKDALVSGWDDAKNRLGLIGDNIVAQARHNADAMRMAWGMDGRNEPSAEKPKSGNSWVPAPDKDNSVGTSIGKDVAKAIMEGKIKEQEALIASEKAILQSREQFLKQYYSNDEISAEEYYGAKNKVIAEAKANIESAFKAEIAAANEYIAFHKKIQGHEKEVEEGKNKIIEAKKKHAADEMALNNQVTQSYMELAAENSLIQRSLLTNAEAEEKLFASRASKIKAFRDAQYYNEMTANRMLETEGRRHQEAMINAMQNDLKRRQDGNALILQNSKTTADQVKGFWLAANQSVYTNQQKTSKLTADAITSATDGVASSISQFILHGKNLGESLKNVSISIVDSFIQGFIKIQIQKFLMDKIAASAYVATITAQSQAMVAMAGLNAFASTAAIPVVGPGLAPAAAAAATAASEGFAATATAAAALSVPSARGGFDIPAGVNPLTQLHEQEMVLPKAESDVIRGLAKSNSSASQSSEMGPIAIHTTINVHADGTATTQTSAGNSGANAASARQLAEMVNNQVQQGIAQAMRQGGLLWKMKNGQA